MPIEWEEKRECQRFNCRAYGNVTHRDNSYPAHILNISQQGALVAILEPHDLQVCDRIKLDIETNDADPIEFEATVAHRSHHYIGLHYNCSEEDQTKLNSLIESKQNNDISPRANA